jgi:hypothetical protein
MRIRRTRTAATVERPAFDWRVIPRASREAAMAEAQGQQEAEGPDVEWIYLQVDEHWVTKRTPADIAAYSTPEPASLKETLADATIGLVIDSVAGAGNL